MSSPLYGAIEAGGTKFLCAVGDSPTDLRDVQRFSTMNNPLETMSEVIAYFERYPDLRSLGLASFGPVDFKTGSIAKTPKVGWSHFPIQKALTRALNIPVDFDTDVNAAALAEAENGTGSELSNFVYFTVGTGIGAGAVVNRQPVHGLLHPEMGHLLVRRAPEELGGFKGICPFHGNCLEGMASGPAMHARWNQSADLLPEDHVAWEIEADYLAQACVNVMCILSPQMIVLGGGVMKQLHLFPMIRKRVADLMNGYLDLPRIDPPALAYPGLSGALLLAQRAAAQA